VIGGLIRVAFLYSKMELIVFHEGGIDCCL
jgi:hypothetical protein